MFVRNRSLNSRENLTDSQRLLHFSLVWEKEFCFFFFFAFQNGLKQIGYQYLLLLRRAPNMSVLLGHKWAQIWNKIWNLTSWLRTYGGWEFLFLFNYLTVIEFIYLLLDKISLSWFNKLTKKFVIQNLTLLSFKFNWKKWVNGKT